MKKITSTPTKDGENIDPNFSTMSAITGSLRVSPTKSCFYDTLPNCTVQFNSKEIKGRESPKTDFNSLINNLDVKKVKKAGQFLDGFSVSYMFLYTYIFLICLFIRYYFVDFKMIKEKS